MVGLLLKDIGNLHVTGDAVACQLLEVLLDFLLDNKDHLVKTGENRVVDRIIQQYLTVSPYRLTPPKRLPIPAAMTTRVAFDFMPNSLSLKILFPLIYILYGFSVG